MYFTYASNRLVAKNSLQEKVQELVLKDNRTLVAHEDLEAFKKKVIDGILQLNKENPRCKPVSPEFYSHNFKDHSLHFSEGVITLHIYQAKATYSNPPKESKNFSDNHPVKDEPTVSETMAGFQLGARVDDNLPC